MGQLVNVSFGACIAARRMNRRSRIARVVFREYEWRVPWSDLQAQLIGLERADEALIRSYTRDTAKGVPLIDVGRLLTEWQEKHPDILHPVALVRQMLGFPAAEIINRAFALGTTMDSVARLAAESQRVREASLFKKET